MIDGNMGQQADAEQAYTQAAFRGTETWVRIPKHQWPTHWEGKYTDPVCPLLLALYGHPESGGVLGTALRGTPLVSWLQKHPRLEKLLLPQTT